MDASAIFAAIAELGTFEVATSRAGIIRVAERGVKLTGIIVSDRPGEDSLVQIEGYPLMRATAPVAAHIRREARIVDYALVLLSLEGEDMRLVAVGDIVFGYSDGPEIIHDVVLGKAA